MKLPKSLIDIATSVNGVPIRLTEERWSHITAGHPEIDSAESSLALTAI